MKSLRIETDLFRKPPFTECDSETAGCLFQLLLYCAERMNSGTIPNCKTWTDRTWIRTCGTSCESIAKAASQGVVAWQGEDLIVHGYPINDEKSYQAKIDAGLETQKRRREKLGAAVGSPSPSPPSSSQSHPSSSHPCPSHDSSQQSSEVSTKDTSSIAQTGNNLGIPDQILSAYEKISEKQGQKVALSAVYASTRLFGPMVTLKQFNATYQHNLKQGLIESPPTAWEDFRDSMNGDPQRPGQTGSGDMSAAVRAKTTEIRNGE